MAQAVYDQHPLGEYLKESWDKRDRLPGTFTDVSDEESEDDLEFTSQSSSLAGTAQALQRWASSLQTLFMSPSDDFAERFKYDLISSNLLSSSVSPSPVSGNSHPTSTMHEQHQRLPGELKVTQEDDTEKVDQDLKPISSAFVLLGLAALMSHDRITALLALLMSVSFAKAPGIDSAGRFYIQQMFESLDNLKTAGSAWDAAVNEAMAIVEREERSTFYTPSSSTVPSPSSILRVTLHSTLLTTQNQCDNVRPLLAALASPMELSQLSEMYAPPSLPKPSYTFQTRPSPPLHKHASSEDNISGWSSSGSTEKRQTWSGSYVNLLGRNSRTRTASVSRKKDWRRSDLSTFSNFQKAPLAKPISPPRSPSLAQVLEGDEDEDQPGASSSTISLNERRLPQDNFGTAALSLRQKRRASGVEALGLSTPRPILSQRDLCYLSPPRSASPRLTSLSSMRHSHSLNALHQVLHAALASRRYACAHLLALRFTEDSEDESYWENVRSVTGLLTSTLEDAVARLNEALAVAADLKRQEGQPTPESSVEGSPIKTPNDELLMSASLIGHRRIDSKSQTYIPKPSALLNLQSSSMSENSSSFAPVPSGISRFASHVDAMSSSLRDAKEDLLECVEELRDAESAAEHADTSNPEALEESILESYERLRKELGFALRECERGKAALLDVLEARRTRNHPQDDAEEEDGDDDSSSGHVRFHTLSGSSKDSTDRTDLSPLTPGDGSPIIPPLSSLEDASTEKDLDDATQHLLLSASSSHLPPPGLEQVFESESTTLTSFARERSKLSRDERIRQMRAKRESMTGRGLAAHLEESDNERPVASHKAWGPGIDVVEELKDVIWKVGERRRKLTQESVGPTLAPVSIPAATAINPLDGSSDYDANLCTS